MLALVTGGNRGIGLAICEGLAAKGVKVLLGCRTEKDGQAEAARICEKKLCQKKLDVTAVVIDVSDVKSIEDAGGYIQKTYGSVDILVNNAGVLPEGSLLDVTKEQIGNGFDVNLFGPINCIRLFAPGMIEKKFGRIINVSSGWGSFAEGLSGPSIYSISKAALNAVTLNVSRSLPSSVTINSICPGWVKTAMGGNNAPLTVEEGADTVIWLATMGDECPTGKFFRARQEISW